MCGGLHLMGKDPSEAEKIAGAGCGAGVTLKE